MRPRRWPAPGCSGRRPASARRWAHRCCFVRHRGAEAALAAGDRHRGGVVVPVLQRARRRLGPGRASRPGRCATATSGWSTARRCGTRARPIADRGLLVARTDPDLPKHRGISFFVIDVDQPGIEIRPIRQMNGRGRVQRDLLHRRPSARRQPDRRAQQRLGRGHGDAHQRARRPSRAAAIPGAGTADRRRQGGQLDRTVGRGRGRRPRQDAGRQPACRSASTEA